MKVLTVLIFLESFLGSEQTSEIYYNQRNLSQMVCAVNEIVNLIFSDYADTLNLISTETSVSFEVLDFKDQLIAKTADTLSVLIRHELTSNIRIVPTRRRRCVIFVIWSFEDFLEAYDIMTPELFKFNGLYLFVFVNGELFEIEQVFQCLWKIQVYNVIVIFETIENTIKLQTFMPFTEKSCDSSKPITIDEYKNGFYVNGKQNLFPNKMNNMHGCTMRISIANSTKPYVISERQTDGSYKVTGGDIRLITALAESLNFEINYVFIGDEGYFYENGTSEGPLKYLFDEKVDMSMSNWWLQNNRLKNFDYVSSYSSDKLVLVIPPGTDLTTLEKLIDPFTVKVWSLILSIFVIGYLVITFIKSRSKVTQRFVFGDSKNPHLNMFIGFYGGSQSILPNTNFARFLLMTFLMYSLVMRTVYQGSYFKLLTSNKRHEEVQSIQEMVDKDFKFLFYTGDADERVEIRSIGSRQIIFYSTSKLYFHAYSFFQD